LEGGRVGWGGKKRPIPPESRVGGISKTEREEEIDIQTFQEGENGHQVRHHNTDAEGVLTIVKPRTPLRNKRVSFSDGATSNPKRGIALQGARG